MTIQSASGSLLAMLALSVLAAAGRAESDEALVRQFHNEAPAQWAEYENRMAQAQGTISFEMTQTLRNIVAKNTSSFRSNSTSKLIMLSMSRTIEGKPDYNTHEVVGINSRYGFKLERRSDSAPWLLTDLVPGAKNYRENSFAQHYSPVTTLIRVTGEPLGHLIDRPGFKITSARNINAGLVELVFDMGHKPDNDSNPIQNGKLVLDPKRFWTVKSYEVRIKSTAQRGQMTFNALEVGEIDGHLPVPKKTVSQTRVEFSDGSKNEQTFQLGFDLSIPRTFADESEFTLSAFGLPEPYGVTWTKRTPVYVWLLASAGVVALLAVGFRYLARRNRPAVAS